MAYATIASRTLQTQGLSGFMSGSAAAVYRNVPHSVLVYSLYPHAAALTKKVSGGREEVFMTRFCAGYITMVGATLVTHPLDTLLVRVSVQPDSATYLQTARRVYTADGVRGLYGGFGATLIGAGPRGAIGFGVFETLKDATKDSEVLNPAVAKFLCGYIAGFVAETAIYPLDIVRR